MGRWARADPPPECAEITADATCGDGENNQASEEVSVEECDDGNARSGDGCSSCRDDITSPDPPDGASGGARRLTATARAPSRGPRAAEAGVVVAMVRGLAGAGSRPDEVGDVAVATAPMHAPGETGSGCTRPHRSPPPRRRSLNRSSRAPTRSRSRAPLGKVTGVTVVSALAGARRSNVASSRTTPKMRGSPSSSPTATSGSRPSMATETRHRRAAARAEWLSPIRWRASGLLRGPSGARSAARTVYDASFGFAQRECVHAPAAGSSPVRGRAAT